jgi:hypothetical protein
MMRIDRKPIGMGEYGYFVFIDDTFICETESREMAERILAGLELLDYPYPCRA